MRNWLEVIADWSEKRRAPLWLQFLAFWIADVLLFNGVQWLVGNNNPSQHLQITYDAAYLPFLVAFFVVARSRARLAYERFRPALGREDGDANAGVAFAHFGAIPVALWTIAGAAFGLSGLLDPVVREQRVSGSLAELLVIGGVGGGLSFGVLAVVAAYAVVLVVRIARLHQRANHIDLFHPAPAHAFARVTALLAGLLVVLTAYSALTDSTTWTNPSNRAVAVGTLVLAAVVFVAPLLGMRAKLRDAKQSLHEANLSRMRSITARIEAAIDAGHDDLVAPMSSSVAALRAERDEIQARSTWPWDVRTFRGIASTFLLPLLIWGITTGISRLLGL